jgi:hypothetical protein
MSFKNFLDLRKKTREHTQIIERVVFQRRSLKSDLFLALSVMLVASTIIWGISKADTVIQSFSKSQTKNFSASGIVLNIDAVSLNIEQAKGSDDVGRTSYTFDISNVEKIETAKYEPISTLDIQLGSKVVVQGKEDGGNITIKRIIYFGIIAPKEETATTTIATTTPNLPEEVATTTATTTETETPSIIDIIKDKVSDVIDSITHANLDGEDLNGQVGTSGTTSEEVATSTATSTPDSSVIPAPVPTSVDSGGIQSENSAGSSTPEQVPDTQTATDTGLGFPGVHAGTSTLESSATPTPSIIENVSNTITDTINNVTDTVTNVVQTLIDTVSGNNTDNQNPAERLPADNSTETPSTQ